MNKFVAVAMLTLAIGSLTACGHEDPNYVPPSPKPSVSEVASYGRTEVVAIPVKGKLITCVVYYGWHENSVSCDWDHPEAIPAGAPGSEPSPPS